MGLQELEAKVERVAHVVALSALPGVAVDRREELAGLVALAALVEGSPFVVLPTRIAHAQHSTGKVEAPPHYHENSLCNSRASESQCTTAFPCRHSGE